MMKRLKKTQFFPWHSFVVLLSIVLLPLRADRTLAADACDDGCQTCAATCCSGTHDTCHCQQTTEEVIKHSWKVSCKKICIPPIRFPWQCGYPTGCGQVRTVRVLEKVESKETECRYQWTVRTVRTGCGCCRDGQGSCCVKNENRAGPASKLSSSTAWVPNAESRWEQFLARLTDHEPALK